MNSRIKTVSFDVFVYLLNPNTFYSSHSRKSKKKKNIHITALKAAKYSSNGNQQYFLGNNVSCTHEKLHLHKIITEREVLSKPLKYKGTFRISMSSIWRSHYSRPAPLQIQSCAGLMSLSLLPEEAEKKRLYTNNVIQVSQFLFNYKNNTCSPWQETAPL